MDAFEVQRVAVEFDERVRKGLQAGNRAAAKD